MNTTNIEEIVQQLSEAKESYYNSGISIISDAKFDALEDQLRTIDRNHPYFSQVGTTHDPEIKEKISHTIPMLSMQKGKLPTDVNKWWEKLAVTKCALSIQPKIDGLSATCCYEHGKLQYVATRGDGSVGQDITHVAQHINDIQNNITFTKERIEVRGELYLPKDTTYDTEGRPLRNNCVGLINRKDDSSDLHHVRFAAFQIVGYSAIAYETEAIALLTAENFNAVSTYCATTMESVAQYYNSYLETLREQWLYETDGLVITIDDRSLFEEIDARWVVDHHHHYAIALKPPSEAKESTLTRIEWQISRQGNAIPVALFEPVIIGGARIERASLSNVDTITRMNICCGDRLLIERANDVIPYVRANISEESRSVEKKCSSISACPSCQTALISKGVHLHCPNRECPETNIQKILFWVKNSDIEHVAEQTIRTLYNIGMAKTIKDLYSLTVEDFNDVEGFATKKSENFVREVQNSRTMSVRDVISKLGIPLVQKKSLAKLKIFTKQDFFDFNDETYVMGKNIIKWRNDKANFDIVNELFQILDITEESPSEEKKKVCMTGKGPYGRKELIQRIEELGYEFVSTITKETNILLCEDTEGQSSKLQKARKNGTTLISYDTFF